MTHEQTPQTPNLDPSLQGEVSSWREILKLQENPKINVEDLFSSNRMQSGEYPDKPGVKVVLGTPIESAVSSKSDVEQDLMAVLALGREVALGVVKSKDQSGSEVSYLSLFNDNYTENEGRAWVVDVLAEGMPITIGRGKLEQVVGREGAVPGVSGIHCTIELRDGILTVVDETSTNGTSLSTNSTNNNISPFNRVQIWSQPSEETKKLIETEKEAKRVSRAAQLGRFTVDQD